MGFMHDKSNNKMSCINLLLTAAVLEGEHNKISMACNYKSFVVQPWPRHRHRDITVEAYTGNEALCMSDGGKNSERGWPTYRGENVWAVVHNGDERIKNLIEARSKNDVMVRLNT